MADLGATYAQQGRIDEACATFAEAAMLASQTTAAEFVQRVVGLRYRYLSAASAEPSVRRLDEQLMALI